MKSPPLALGLLVLLTCHRGPFESRAEACAIASFDGVEVFLATERVAIVWDAENRRQHFIRDAHFQGEAGAFGFLVPTPTMPELAESDDAILDRLQLAMRREYITENEYMPTTCCLAVAGATFGLTRSADDALAPVMAGPPAVEVVGSQRVGDLDASILRVNDAEALPAWLAENGFKVADSILEWARPYADDGHLLTAFKFEPADDASAFQTGAIRISFDTERPFYPYREPANAGERRRSLQVYFLGDERASGSVGEGTFGTVFYADNVPSLVDTEGLTSLGVDAGTWLTVFNDSTSPRPDHDVFFHVAAGAVVHPDPIVTVNTIPIPIPVEIIVPLGLVWFWRRRKRVSSGS